MTERTWEIEMDGRKLTVTLSQFRAMLDARAAMAKPIMDAVKRGDINACGKAQEAMCKAFA